MLRQVVSELHVVKQCFAASYWKFEVVALRWGNLLALTHLHTVSLMSSSSWMTLHYSCSHLASLSAPDSKAKNTSSACSQQSSQGAECKHNLKHGLACLARLKRGWGVGGTAHLPIKDVLSTRSSCSHHRRVLPWGGTSLTFFSG